MKKLQGRILLSGHHGFSWQRRADRVCKQNRKCILCVGPQAGMVRIEETYKWAKLSVQTLSWFREDAKESGTVPRVDSACLMGRQELTFGGWKGRWSLSSQTESRLTGRIKPCLDQSGIRMHLNLYVEESEHLVQRPTLGNKVSLTGFIVLKRISTSFFWPVAESYCSGLNCVSLKVMPNS